MPTVVVEQVRPTVALAAQLQNDANITLLWCVNDEHGRAISSQTCTLTIAGQALTATVGTNDRKYSFRISKGMQAAQMTAHVRVNLAAAGTQGAVSQDSNQLQVIAGSASDADSDASKTVYSEFQQELRRTRTLYETFLVVVTGALATVFSKRSDIAGAYRPSIAYGLAFLALIVIYMIWQIAERYRKTTSAVFNLERSWGLRAGSAGEYPLDGDVSWWRNHAWRHTLWAAGLTLYALLAIAVVINYLHAPAEPAKPATPPVSVSCSCGAPCGKPGQDKQMTGPASTKGKKTLGGKATN